MYTAYTKNDDGSINVLAGSGNPKVFKKILPDTTEYQVHEGTIYIAGGKSWLSESEPGYQAAMAEAKKKKALAELDAQYEADKKELLAAYTDALLSGDTESQESCQADMATLNEQYDSDYKAITEGK